MGEKSGRKKGNVGKEKGRERRYVRKIIWRGGERQVRREAGREEI